MFQRLAFYNINNVTMHMYMHYLPTGADGSKLSTTEILKFHVKLTATHHIVYPNTSCLFYSEVEVSVPA